MRVAAVGKSRLRPLRPLQVDRLKGRVGVVPSPVHAVLAERHAQALAQPLGKARVDHDKTDLMPGHRLEIPQAGNREHKWRAHAATFPGPVDRQKGGTMNLPGHEIFC